MNWMHREAVASPPRYIGGDKPAAVYVIGQYRVTVYGATPEHPAQVTYCRDSYAKTNPRDTLPNMEIRDGEIRIPLIDLVGEVLARVTPVELAESLWSVEGVREAFCDVLVKRYNEVGIGDAERRQVLSGVKEEIHAKAVDDLVGTMARIEYAHSRQGYLYEEIYRINAELQRVDLKDKDGNPWRIAITHDNEVTKVGGQAWTEAREYWRAQINKLFPPPPPFTEARNDIL